MRARWLVVLALLAGACSGGGDDGADRGSSSSSGSSSADEETTTTGADERQVELPTSFRAEGSVDAPGFETVMSAVVADPTHYDLVLDTDVSHFRVVRDGQVVFLRTAPDATIAEDRSFTEGTPEDSTALAFLLETAAFGPAEEGFALSGAETASDPLAELLFTDPAELLDLDEARPDRVFDVELPAEVAAALDDLDLDEPELEARVDVDADGVVVLVELRATSDDVEVDIEARYDDLDEVTDTDVVVPTADQIDRTPFVDEDELLAYTETPLLVPPAPPEGMALVAAVVLDPFETREGCRQVQIDYAPPEDPFSEDFVEYFLIDKTCVNQFDPAPFDEVTGAFPSRYDGFEILVDATVVQVAAGDIGFDVAAFVASLAPTTAEVLVASVVPPPD